jgi:hypothetical protein
MTEERQSPRGCAPLTAARRKQDRQHHHERELSGGEIARGGGPDADPSREHRRTPSGGGKAAWHGYCPGDRSTFKGRSPHSRPKASRAKSPPTCTRVPTLRHGGQTPHVIQTGPKSKEGGPPHKERATAPRLCATSFSGQPAVRKANRRTRSIQPPRG